MKQKIISMLLLVTVIPAVSAAPEVNIKDIATLQGIRENQLVGIGLVTGLAGKGDSADSVLLKKTVSNLLSSFGLSISEDEVKSKNCAIVMVSATVPPFARPGERIDILVASIGDARSLEGGILLQTNLRAANQGVYAVGQGIIEVSSDRNASKTSGSVTAGAIMEREVVSTFVQNSRVSLVLKNPDFVTASLVAEAVKAAFTDAAVTTVDSALIDIQIPPSLQGDPVAFIARLEKIRVQPDPSNVVLINTKTKVIVIGENVRIGRVAVSYKDINVRVGAAASWGDEEKPSTFVIEETASVEDFVQSLNQVGLETDVIIEIIKAIDRAGALYGRLVLI